MNPLPPHLAKPTTFVALVPPEDADDLAACAAYVENAHRLSGATVAWRFVELDEAQMRDLVGRLIQGMVDASVPHLLVDRRAGTFLIRQADGTMGERRARVLRIEAAGPPGGGQ